LALSADWRRPAAPAQKVRPPASVFKSALSASARTKRPVLSRPADQRSERTVEAVGMWANVSARLSKGCGRSAVHSPACPRRVWLSERRPHQIARPTADGAIASRWWNSDRTFGHSLAGDRIPTRRSPRMVRTDSPTPWHVPGCECVLRCHRRSRPSRPSPPRGHRACLPNARLRARTGQVPRPSPWPNRRA
jgi:hypothetical protein